MRSFNHESFFFAKNQILNHERYSSLAAMDSEKSALKIVQKLNKAGYAAYFAGGWVRDYLLDHPSDDIDIATSAKPETVVELFSKTILVGMNFGVVVVLIDGHQFEVATFREDLGYEDGRRPTQCAYTDAEGDARRRDFTINGMFYDPIEKKVIDFVGGKKDLEKGIVRAIGNPHERFQEDRLRMIRAVRFAYRFRYEIDKETQCAIKAHADALLPAVAMERIWHEFQKMARYRTIGKAILKMFELGLLQTIFPPLNNLSYEELQKRAAIISCYPPDCPAVLLVMELFPDAALEELIAYCYYLKASNKEIKLVEFAHQVRQLESHCDSDWVPFYAHPQAAVVFQAVCARGGGHQWEIHQERMDRLKEHIERVVQKKPVVSAKLLQKEGIAPGKQMGDLIKEAERLAITHNLHEPKEVLSLLKQSPKWDKA